MIKRLKDGCLILLTIGGMYHSGFAQTTADKPAVINVDLSKSKGEMRPVWAWFGYDEPNYTYMKDGKKLLSELAALSPGPIYVRTHNLLTTGDGTAALKWGSTGIYTEDKNGNPVYNWKIVDSIFDTFVKRRMKPLAQIGFMPEALSIHPQPYQHHWKPGDPYKDIITGWAYPPKDYQKWGDLIYTWVKHCVDRYGKKEVASWYWEVWNEPNGYWKGTMEEYFKLYDYSARAVKKALPEARIGGLDIAGTSSPGGTKWLNAFLKHCALDTNYATGKIGAPLDVVLFHAKGSPTLVNGMVRMNMSTQLKDIATGFKSVTAYPQFKNLPLIVGESDPEGCAACGMATNPSNAYRNGTMFSSYTAASFAREYELWDQYQINFLGAVTWSFEFEDQPWFYGFRDLATNGVDKPVLNVFRMFGKMTGERVEAHSSRMYPLQEVIDSSIRKPKSDIGALASKDVHTAGIMIWNYHDDDQQGPSEKIQLTVKGIPATIITLIEYRIDRDHSNAYEIWKKMGSPQHLDKSQVARLQKDGQLQAIGESRKLSIKDGMLQTDINLPRQGVSLLKLDW